jgi:hypothetical protein
LNFDAMSIGDLDRAPAGLDHRDHIIADTLMLISAAYAALLVSVVVAADSSVYRVAESRFCSSAAVILMTTSAIIPNRVKPVMIIPHAISIVLTSSLLINLVSRNVVEQPLCQ